MKVIRHALLDGFQPLVELQRRHLMVFGLPGSQSAALTAGEGYADVCVIGTWATDRHDSADGCTGAPPVSDPAPGSQRRTPHEVPLARRAGVWLLWWVLMMSFWIIEDDSLRMDELLAGAGAAALAAALAEVAGYQAASRLRMRIEWVTPALTIPADIVTDTFTVFGALWRRLVHGVKPEGDFAEIPVRYGGETLEDKTRRALLVGGKSVAPNTIVLGLDRDRGVIVVHHLVPVKD